MVKPETMSTRSPRGTKPVSEAFFAALARIPDASRAVVAKAAQAMIRDELKVQRDRAKAADARQKTVKPPTKVVKSTAARHPVAAKSSAKKAAPTKAFGTKASAPTPKAKAPKPATSVRAKNAATGKPEAKPVETATAA